MASFVAPAVELPLGGNKAHQHTVPVGLAKIGTSRYQVNIGTYSASVMITIIPVMIIFAVFQRWFIAGMTMGALKH